MSEMTSGRRWSVGEHGVEAAVGLLVLIVATAFLAYALSAGVGRGSPKGYPITAKFGQVGGLARGAGVRIAGVKVGTVSDVTLDPTTYLAVTRLRLDSNVKLPSDSTAKIATDGLLGAAYVSVLPGGATDMLKPGDEIANTQGAVDLFGLIGQAMRPQAAPSAASATAARP